MTSLVFYTTVGCHLCEEAEQMLRQMQAQHYFEWQAVDIADDVELVRLYGIRIPVLKILGANNELRWPFDPLMLVEFLPVHIQNSEIKGSGIP